MDHDREDLREVAHCSLACVRLPVGVAGETPRLHERQVPGAIGQLLRVERQPGLRHEDSHHRYETHRGKQQHRPKVSQPGHLLARINTGEPINQILNGREDWVEKGFPAGINLGHELAHDRSQGYAQAEEQNDLDYLDSCHSSIRIPIGFLMSMLAKAAPMPGMMSMSNRRQISTFGARPLFRPGL